MDEVSIANTSSNATGRSCPAHVPLFNGGNIAATIKQRTVLRITRNIHRISFRPSCYRYSSCFIAIKPLV